MKKVIDLLKKTEIKEGLEGKKSSPDTVRLLYVSPLLNSDGYYRMILPYLELGKVKGFETRVTSITKWDFSKKFTIGTDTIEEEEIRWADYIIFPMLIENYRYLFQAIRILNPKVYLVMDIVRQIHKIPKSHADHGIYSKFNTEQLLGNIVEMDMITTPLKMLCELYRKWLNMYVETEREVAVFLLPSLISSIGFEGITSIPKPQEEIVRVGMIGTLKAAKDFRYFLPLFKKIKEKYKDKVELIIFGWDGKNQSGNESLKGVEITFHKSVSFLNYYQTLKNLHLDILLIPMRSLHYYTYSNTIKFLEAAALGIPVIALAHSSFDDEINDGENGVLAWKLPEWEEKLVALIDNPKNRIELGERAKKWVWDHRVYDQNNLLIFKSIFI
ncbi:glycosyltransferase [Aquimarina sp. TRL1]|uniref:glycosyltransferase n=1 Tax=Aquimarina sp. (strain TRL1) TaxID=2736252 RepID=UPI00158F0574|nr:glycosyltransferase [Aquimarina sp. TRL1]QKX04184.1 glycosyltransferase [Aquimarina sp. TRL1]